jgi:hypothetical protein
MDPSSGKSSITCTFYGWTTIVMVALSIVPGPITLAVLWIDANSQVKPIRTAADDLETRATRGSAERTT